ncbi:hypothetical protein ACFWNQ_20265 [Streptomyces virginiae]|uniref:hypothetical protein n=1 Tax=Streptomyces virginiae TaxID=1961 RepID=UPI0036536B3B
MTTTASPSGESAESTAAPGAQGAVSPQASPQVSPPPQPSPEAVAEQAIRTEALLQLGGWFASSILFALMPTFIQVLAGRQTAGYVQPEFLELLSRAQLYMVCIGITIQAAVQALQEMRKKGSAQLAILCLLNLIIMFIATLLASTADGPTTIKPMVGQQSMFLFIGAMLVSGSTTWICSKEAARRDL